VFSDRTSVGLDVHARSMAAAAIDTQSGATRTARSVPASSVFEERLLTRHPSASDALSNSPAAKTNRMRPKMYRGRPDKAPGSRVASPLPQRHLRLDRRMWLRVRTDVPRLRGSWGETHRWPIPLNQALLRARSHA